MWRMPRYTDNLKKNLCEKHGIKLLYYANYKYDFPYEVITNTDELIKQIKLDKTIL